jgi:hypothetical protein
VAFGVALPRGLPRFLFGRVFRRFHRPLAWLTLLAWLSASGLSWDALQVVAWVNMSVANSRDGSVTAAVRKTLSDAPCPLCRAAQEGRKRSERSPLASQESLKAKTKTFSTLGGGELVAPSDETVRFDRPAGACALVRPTEVPVPPPRVQG